MEYRKLGESDLELSVITFGAWAAGGWNWGGTDQKKAVEAMRVSYDLGVTTIDTAPIYGQGLSEEIVGEAVKDIPRDQIQILTKYGMRWDLRKGVYEMTGKDHNGKEVSVYKYGGKESIIKECEDSLQRLGTDYIDLYQMHWPDQTTPIEETMEAVQRLKDQGKIIEAGVSNFSVAEMEAAEKVVKLISNQVPYSMLNRGIEEELIPYCRKNKKGILAYSPLQRGLLTGKMTPGYAFKEGDSRSEISFFSDENIRRVNKFLDAIKPVAREKGATLAQLVIQWTIRQPGITIALVGARNPKQAVENAKAVNFPLSSDEMKLINDNLESVVLDHA